MTFSITLRTDFSSGLYECPVDGLIIEGTAGILYLL
jgi:hypothetical protein